MNAVVRRALLGVPGVGGVYRRARKAYHHRRVMKAAARCFVNLDEYRRALDADDGGIVEIGTHDGLVFSIRRNAADAWVLAEIFLDEPYVRGLRLGPEPVVVDIGGYIGDFALYAARRLKARKVVVCEPSPKNQALLRQNVASNRCDRQIAIVNKAVTDGGDVLMDVDVPDRGQARVSAYYGSAARPSRIPGISLGDLFRDHQLDAVDLLKIDCEGGEYAILLTAPADVLRRVRHLVFEFHEIPGFEPRLRAVKERLAGEGFRVATRGSLVVASRDAASPAVQ